MMGLKTKTPRNFDHHSVNTSEQPVSTINKNDPPDLPNESPLEVSIEYHYKTPTSAGHSNPF